ncbi:hypothetical protein BDN70DRAFT_939126 [Pholiota conissans]|uniref:Uncharacterized protein n=1 Tax=Pholiota conissans TaxID=109636 RepID=A0A9P5YM86_9AGAR|nr:hypothetical protein BDN70DRAFT_939126 [Pholiota conissans]
MSFRASTGAPPLGPSTVHPSLRPSGRALAHPFARRTSTPGASILSAVAAPLHPIRSKSIDTSSAPNLLATLRPSSRSRGRSRLVKASQALLDSPQAISSRYILTSFLRPRHPSSQTSIVLCPFRTPASPRHLVTLHIALGPSSAYILRPWMLPPYVAPVSFLVRLWRGSCTYATMEGSIPRRLRSS